MADANKTEKPTPRRRQKAREQGQVARSRDLIGGLATLAAVLTVAMLAPSFTTRWRGFLREVLDVRWSGGVEDGTQLLRAGGLMTLQTAGPALLLAWSAAMVGAFAQGGLVFVPATLAPNWERFNPAKKLGQLFSLPALGRLLKSLLPGAAVLYFAVAILARDWGAFGALSHQSVRSLAAVVAGKAFEVAWKASLVLLAWAGADYLLERQHMEGELRMSRQEVMEEYKETEGHPTVRARIRRLQRQLRKRRMLEEVKRATVVITNPTEFAVALAYRPTLAAPMVVAKGRNLVARQIKELARWQGIPLVENPPLAHALYRAVEVGQSIPPKLYAVVAAVLAAIYRAQDRAASAGGK